MNRHVLIADPDEDLLREYTDSLRGHGVDVTTVTNGLDCLAEIRCKVPDVLVIDPELPWGSGMGVLALMLEEGLTRTPVLLLASSREHVQMHVPLPDYLFMLKPVSSIALLGLIRALAIPYLQQSPC